MSNEDAIYILSYIKNFRVQGKDAIDAIDIGINAIKQLPSVTQKSGKWINDKNDIPICSRCGYIPQYDRAIDDYEYSNYCPLCGAKMESEE